MNLAISEMCYAILSLNCRGRCDSALLPPIKTNHFSLSLSSCSQQKQASYAVALTAALKDVLPIFYSIKLFELPQS